jgi:hypothetical protein
MRLRTADEVNLMRSCWPLWRLRRHTHSISIFPSLWLSEGCDSHFWLVKNGILWARDWEQFVNPAQQQRL